jgi:hypothetical protein
MRTPLWSAELGIDQRNHGSPLSAGIPVCGEINRYKSGMSEGHAELRATLRRDLAYLYKHGLKDSLARANVPALVPLAETLTGKTEDETSCVDLVLEFLRSAIDEMPTSDQWRKVGEAMTALFGIQKRRMIELTTRLDEAALVLGYANGQSLRRSKRNEIQVTELLLDDLTNHIVELAVRHPAYNAVIDGERRLSLHVSPEHEPKQRSFSAGTQMDEPWLLWLVIHSSGLLGPIPNWTTISRIRLRVALSTSADILHISAYLSEGTRYLAIRTLDLVSDDLFTITYTENFACLLSSKRGYRLDDEIIGPGVPVGPLVMRSLLDAGTPSTDVPVVLGFGVKWGSLKPTEARPIPMEQHIRLG